MELCNAFQNRHFVNPRAALIGVPTGAVSGFDVLDIDPKSGGTEWEAKNAHRLPATLIHHTRSGGYQVLGDSLYFDAGGYPDRTVGLK